jgi:uncharacterized membrane protein
MDEISKVFSDIKDKFNIKRFIITFLIMISIDFLFLTSSYSKKTYAPIINNGMKGMNTRIIPAVAAWIVMSFSLEVFIFSNDNKTLTAKVINAGLLGFCIYMVYNLTNFATINWWSSELTYKDVAWGTSLYMLMTYIITGIIKL